MSPKQYPSKRRSSVPDRGAALYCFCVSAQSLLNWRPNSCPHTGKWSVCRGQAAGRTRNERAVEIESVMQFRSVWAGEMDISGPGPPRAHTHKHRAGSFTMENKWQRLTLGFYWWFFSRVNVVCFSCNYLACMNRFVFQRRFIKKSNSNHLSKLIRIPLNISYKWTSVLCF